MLEVIDGNGPYTIVYSGPSTGTFTTDESRIEFLVGSPGTYTVTVTGAEETTSTASVTVGGTATLLYEAIASPAQCGPGSVRTEASGTPPYTYTIQGGDIDTTFNSSEFWVDISNLPPGDYVLTATDASGCTASLTTTVSGQTGVTIDAAVTNSSGCASTGSITYTFGGMAPFEVTIITASIFANYTVTGNTLTINNLAPDTYIVQAVASCSGRAPGLVPLRSCSISNRKVTE